MSLEQFPDAIAAFERATELDPTNMAAWQLRGLCQRALRNVRRRLGETVVELESRHSTISAEAIAAMDGVDPATADCCARGTALASRGDIEEALACFVEATTLTPSSTTRNAIMRQYGCSGSPHKDSQRRLRPP